MRATVLMPDLAVPRSPHNPPTDRPGSDPSALTIAVHDRLAAAMAAAPSQEGLEMALRLLAKWRASVLANTLRARKGHLIAQGPFKGMIYDTPASEGGYLPRRLGCYEASLAPIIEDIVQRAYPHIYDIGAAEGYYAVGLARRMPASIIHAHDSNPAARALCAALAAANDVAGRVIVGGELDHAGLADLGPGPVLIICDIEGAEADLLDPARAPALRRADILVEVHETDFPGLTARITERFAPSHTIARIGRALAPAALAELGDALSDLDRLLMLWEWRSGPTPWLWMQAH